MWSPPSRELIFWCQSSKSIGLPIIFLQIQRHGLLIKIPILPDWVFSKIEKIRLDTGSAICAVFSAFATPGCRRMFMDGGYTAAPISQDNLCVSIVLEHSRKDDITAYNGWLCRWMSESYYRQAPLRVSSPQFYVSFSKTGTAARFSTRNKLVIGCIDRSSANISFVLNSAPYNCLHISW